MLNDLLAAYQRKTLKSFSQNVNIFDRSRGCNTHSIEIIEKCKKALISVSEFASCETFLINFM